MKTNYFTLGQQHAHRFGMHTLDRDVVIKITAPDPRARMFELFGAKWAMQHDTLPDMSYYPRGVFDVDEGKFVEVSA